MPGSVIVAGARTPIGKLSGSLKNFTAMDLGGFAIKAALEKAGITGDAVEYVIMGHVIQAGAGQITARQAAIKGGISMNVPALTVNKVCLSGLNAIALADLYISSGQYDVIVAGGMESMTNTPHLLPGARGGFRYGDAKLLDATAHDALFCAFDQVAMGESTEKYNARLGISREEQDEFSARSHERAAAAMKEGRFDAELVSVQIPQRKGDPLVVSEDEGVRPGTTPESLASAAAGLRRRRHHHRRFGLADLRRWLRARGHVAAQGRGAGRSDPRRDRCRRLRCGSRRLAAVAARERHRSGAGQGGPERRRPRSRRDQ